MKKHLKSILSLFVLITILILPYFVFAQSPLETLKDVQPGSGYEPSGEQGQASIGSITGYVINGFFSLLGIIFIILMLLGGYYYMIAGGDQAKVDKGLAYIRRGVIGLIIIVGSYAIWTFVLEKLINRSVN